MTTPLTAEEETRYTQIIDAILSTADLETVSRKKVRKGLEKALGKDLRDQKVAITALIEARFDAINSQSQSNGRTPSPVPKEEETYSPPKRSYSSYEEEETNGHHHASAAAASDDDDESHNEIKVSLPVKKKHKRSPSSVEDADARLAAELQAQENRLARGRTTRGGGPAKAKPRKKAPKKKSSAKVKEGDDSDVDTDASGVVKEKRKAGGGFQKPFNLSYQLGELVGVTQVVKKLWEHIKGHNLQDPNDKRQIICDEKMQAVFKQSRVDMFQMNKLLGNHLYPIDEE